MRLFERVTRDLRLAATAARALRAVGAIRPDSPRTFADLFEERVDQQPERVALIQGDREVRYAELDAMANRFARWAQRQGLGRGDTVALLLGNRPELPAAWLGLAKIGAVGALLNHHLRGRALAHCAVISGARAMVVHAEFAETWQEAASGLEDPPELFAQGGPTQGTQDLDERLSGLSSARPDRRVRTGLRAGDDLLYIYTSGTTGLPKAARVSHLRGIGMTQGGIVALDLTPEDRSYVALPLYHSAGGVMALGGALLSGGSAVIAPGFSATRFFDDCARHEVTVFQYIGELCRYLLATPEGPSDRAHRIRACIGNGLRPEIWEPFQERFAIPKIVEFYGATEGNVALMNYEGKVGSVGRMPRLLRQLTGLRLIRYDVERETHERDENGFCIACGPGEPGEALGRISTLARFEGYTDRGASDAKVLRDVFEPGDAFFRTGDLLRFDEDDYFYFVDRIGDTFRWKGENVSTSEVAEVLSRAKGVVEANVYGVEIPGQEGRAGMAALVTDGCFDPGSLHDQVEAELPSYARPRFLRLQPEMETTGTFKHRKVDLAKQGFDPTAISDPLLVLDLDEGRYTPLDAAGFQEIATGQRRL